MGVRYSASLLVAGMFFAGTTVSAHHGGAVYDASAPVTLNGEVTQFRFVYPHVLVYFAVEGEDGETVEWSGEMTTPNRLARGVGGGGATNNVRWTTETLKPGDLLEVTGEPARNGAPSMRIRRIVDANGVALLGGAEGESGVVASVESRARRATFNASKSGETNLLGGNELVDDVSSGRVDFDSIEKQDLPEPLQAMPAAAAKEKVRQVAAKRQKLQREIQELAQQRRDFLSEKVEEAGGAADSLDARIYGAVREQAAARGLEYEAAEPAY